MITQTMMMGTHAVISAGGSLLSKAIANIHLAMRKTTRDASKAYNSRLMMRSMKTGCPCA
jgi:dihydrodipicolinate synthase/N-acetylneuraminate lyase